MFTDFFGFFLRSAGLWSASGTTPQQTRLTMLEREEGAGASLLFQLQLQRKKIKRGENIFSTL
tara:strand:- start:12296 stop:12484 length:189 start_codon:yes stop_codon:yes gene_type:complete